MFLKGIIKVVFSFYLFVQINSQIDKSRTFVIDYENNQFLKDGEPFRYISGSMHYFRVPPVHWSDRFLKFKACGLNTVQTYIEWSSHEPELGSYDFSGNNDFVKFINLAQQMDLNVIMRLGPFIASERDNMGLPYWLPSKFPNITYRTSDPNFLQYVDAWYSVLLPKLKPLLYENGGPVILLQVENEYGSYFACDFEYTAHLRNLFRSYLGDTAVLFTVDGGDSGYLKCGRIENVYSTVDFGPEDPKYPFGQQRLFEESGPLVNTEYYPGWFDVWGEPHQTVSNPYIYTALDLMLTMNASVNIYMFHGGTSWGFMAGGTTSPYKPMTTSYDYDAPISECGDLTEKYFSIRDVISKHTVLPDLPVPADSEKMELQPIIVSYVNNMFNMLSNPVYSAQTLSFEELNLRHGFVYYTTNISFFPSDPSLLSIQNGVYDRAMIFVDKVFKGILSRIENIEQMPLSVANGSELGILVENEGHACCSKIAETKGIIGNVLLGSRTLIGWNMYRLFPNWTNTLSFIERSYHQSSEITDKLRNSIIPSFYTGSFVLPNQTDLPLDTFFSLETGRKGIAFINGFNIGRYWPVMGPQITLYAPLSLFNPYPITNYITILELEKAINDTLTVKFTKQHILNGTTPENNSMVRDITKYHP